MQADDIKRLIEAGLPNSEVFVEGDGTHFNAHIINPAFAGKTRVQRQQMIYDTVRAQLLDGSLHALSLKTFTPDEWQKLDG